jgi:hypothetical protein
MSEHDRVQGQENELRSESGTEKENGTGTDIVAEPGTWNVSVRGIQK